MQCAGVVAVGAVEQRTVETETEFDMLYGVGSVSGKGGRRSRKGGLRENGARQEGAQAGLPGPERPAATILYAQLSSYEYNVTKSLPYAIFCSYYAGKQKRTMSSWSVVVKSCFFGVLCGMNRVSGIISGSPVPFLL